MFCLIESDLHSILSRYRRRDPLKEEDIKRILSISGYEMHLPRTWYKHGQARILVYSKDDINVEEIKLSDRLSDLPIMSFYVRTSKEKKTIVNYFYREFTGGVSGLEDIASQNERLRRMTDNRRQLNKIGKDVVCMGNANLCGIKWMIGSK